MFSENVTAASQLSRWSGGARVVLVIAGLATTKRTHDPVSEPAPGSGQLFLPKYRHRGMLLLLEGHAGSRVTAFRDSSLVFFFFC